jgi:hypothetical protein
MCIEKEKKNEKEKKGWYEFSVMYCPTAHHH